MGKNTYVLKDIALSLSGVTLRNGLQLKETGVLPVLQPSNLVGDELAHPSYLQEYPDSLKKHFLKKGDLLLANKGSKFATHLFRHDYPCIASASFFVIRVRQDKCYPEFLQWYLKQPVAKDYFLNNSATATIPSLRKTALDDLPIPVPPLAVQKKIADILQVVEQQETLLTAMLRKLDGFREASIWELLESETNYAHD